MSKDKPLHIIRPVRFDKETDFILQGLAEKDGVSLSEYIRRSTTAFAMQYCEHQELLSRLNPRDIPSAQKTFYEEMDTIRIIFCKELNNIREEFRMDLFRIEEKVERLTYSLHLHSRPVPSEGKEDAIRSANERTAKLFSGLKRTNQEV